MVDLVYLLHFEDDSPGGPDDPRPEGGNGAVS